MEQEIVIEMPIEKMIENYKFNEEIVNKMYNGDYKKLALDLAKENQRFSLKETMLQQRIDKAIKYINKNQVGYASLINCTIPIEELFTTNMELLNILKGE